MQTTRDELGILGSSINHKTIRRAVSAVAILAIGSVVALTTGVGQAAAATFVSQASGTYLTGGLLTGTLSNAIDLSGESAANDGTTETVTNRNNLDLSLLNSLTVTATNGVQIPLSIANAGVISQYASATAAGASTGATGLIASDGTIGTTGSPDTPADLHLDLGNAVTSLTGVTGTNQLAGLDLSLGATSSRASRTGTAASTRIYAIADADLDFTSPALAGIATPLTTDVNSLTSSIGGLKAGIQGVGLGALATATVSTPNILGDVTPLLTGPIGNLNTNGVTIDLSTGAVHVNLAKFADLNAATPTDRDLLTAADITAINAAISSLLSQITTTITNDVNAVTVNVTTVGNLVTIHTTLGRLLAGTANGDVTIGGGLLSAAAVIALLAPVIAPVGTLLSTTNGVVTTAGTTLTAALTTVIPLVLALHANLQSTTGGTDSVTALQVGILPGVLGANGQLDVATSTVGPNVDNPAPTITSLTPTHGTEAGGTSVTITGTRLDTATGVTIGGTTVPIDSQTSTSLTFTTPAHGSGGVTVAVDAPQGNSGTLAYTYDGLPSVVTGATPLTGPDTGGTVVHITGTGFEGATSVTFGGTAGTITAQTPTSITVTAPAHPAGGVDLVVNDPDGNSTARTFTYTAVPSTLTSITPAVGPETGGTTVAITGTDLLDATGATFDGVPGTSFHATSETAATVVSPAHVPGTVQFEVINPANTNGHTGHLDYQYLPAASVATSLDPTTGPETGGTTVTVTGSGFTGATGVTFDGTPGTGFTVDNDTTITVTSPPHAAGNADVVVDDPTGNSAALPYAYTAVASSISSLSPVVGPVTGDTLVTIKGSGFIGATGVTFGGTAATGFTIVNPTTITVLTPAHDPGVVNVVVDDPAGNSAPGTFTYQGVKSTVTSLDPTSGPELGGSLVTITGSGLLGSTGATFGGIPGTVYTVVSDTEATVITPPHAASPVAVPVVIDDPVGNGTGLTFLFVPQPLITGLTPPSGTVAGGTAVTITGLGFTGATSVTFDGVAATQLDVVSDTEITVASPVHPVAGPVDVVVHHAAVDSNAGTYTYVAEPSVTTSLSPASGPDTGGTAVVIKGSGFLGATGVTFGTTPGTGFTVVNDTTIDVSAPAHADGSVGVVVADPQGDSDPLPFDFTPVTTITSVNPHIGPEAGGTTVVIDGTCFAGATAVQFGSTSVTSFTVNGAGTEITVLSPAGSGNEAVTVIGTTSCGNATATTPFTYIAAASVAASMTPTKGTEKGGTHVVITGSGFTGSTGVTFDGITGTHFRVVNDTTIDVRTPAHDPGKVDVVVADPAGTSLPLSFTYLADAATSTPASTSSSAVLGYTGVDPTALLIVIALLLAAGGAMVSGNRRRSRF